MIGDAKTGGPAGAPIVTQLAPGALRPGTQVFVNWVKKSLPFGKDSLAAAVARLHGELGAVAVPHLPACRFASEVEPTTATCCRRAMR